MNNAIVETERCDPLDLMRSGARFALFLDFDGTLVDIASTPESIVVPADLPPLLRALEQRLDGALAIVTGRPIEDIDRFLEPDRYVAAGLHGAEYRTSRDEIVRPAATPIDPSLVEAIRGLEAITPGILVEPKGATVAVHWRNAPDAEIVVERELRRLVDVGPSHLEVSRGRRVFEVCPRHVSKGAALEILADLPAFRERVPIMIGDDVTDESAIATATRMGGAGFRVRGETFAADRATFETPGDVRAWLAALVETLSR